MNDEFTIVDDPAEITRPRDGEVNGGFDTLEAHGVAKNTIAVTAVERLLNGYRKASDVRSMAFLAETTPSTFIQTSGAGPTDDGRIKPDIAAAGDWFRAATLASDNTSYDHFGATSSAAPSVAGGICLLQELYGRYFIGTPLASTMKALVIHTADEAGVDGGGVSIPGPDYRFGWGLFNAASAARLLNRHYLESSASRIYEFTYTGTPIDFEFKTDGKAPVRVTMVWTDPAHSPAPAILDPTNSMLVNNLDIRVSTGVGFAYPWSLNPASPALPATRGGVNNRDNVERIDFTPSVAGTSVGRISHQGTLTGGSQAVSVIVTAAPPTLEWMKPNAAGGTYSEIIDVAPDAEVTHYYDPVDPNVEINYPTTAEYAYVTGYRTSATTGKDFYTAKYDRAGNIVWESVYTGTVTNSIDEATDILVTPNYVYVAGFSGTSGATLDFVVIRYNKSDGSPSATWANLGAGAGIRRGGYVNAVGPVAIVAESSGTSDSVYLTAGASQSGGSTGRNFVTVKYNNSGGKAWAADSIYTGLGGANDDVSTMIAVDFNDNGVIVAGGSKGSGSDPSDYALVKYRKDTGAQTWAKRYDGYSDSDVPNDITVDHDDAIYITGCSVGNGSKLGDFATLKYTKGGGVSWTRRYDGNNQTVSTDDTALDIEVDDDKNVYVSGYTNYGTTTAMVHKYNSAGGFSGTWNNTEGYGDGIRAMTGSTCTRRSLVVENATGSAVLLARRGGTLFSFETRKYQGSDGTILWSETGLRDLVVPNCLASFKKTWQDVGEVLPDETEYNIFVGGRLSSQSILYWNSPR